MTFLIHSIISRKFTDETEMEIIRLIKTTPTPTTASFVPVGFANNKTAVPAAALTLDHVASASSRKENQKHTSPAAGVEAKRGQTLAAASHIETQGIKITMFHTLPFCHLIHK